MRKTIYAAIALILGSSKIDAQTASPASTRVGPKVLIGGILGSAGGEAEGEGFDRTNGYGDRYSFGYYVNPSLSIEIDGSSLRTNGRTQKDIYLLFGASLYPNKNSGIYFSAAVGHGRSEVKDGNDFIKVSGVAFSIGAGYDIPIDEKFLVSPFARLMTTTGGGVQYLGSKVIDANINQLQIGLSFVWQ